MNLTHFPSEILDNMLSTASKSFLCVRLWKTGDRQLMHRLATSITSLDLLPTQAEYKFPSMVSQLGALRHFCIATEYIGVLEPLNGSEMLQILPRTLESLHLHFKLFTVREAYGRRFTPDFHEIWNFANLKALFPQLLSLTVDPGWSSSNAITDGVSSTNLITVLPSTLTMLRTSRLILMEPSCVAQLPRNLTSLDSEISFDFTRSNCSEAPQNFWQDAPPHLEYIRYLRIPRSSSPSQWLPKSLTRIDHCILPPCATQALCHPIPAKRLTIEAQSDQPNPVPRSWTIPQHITDLELSEVWGFSSTGIPSLPPSLTRLKIDFRASRDIGERTVFDSLSSLWPSTLTNLDAVTPNNNALRHFPHTLRILRTRQNSLSEPLNLDLLPPLLTTLQVRSRSRFIGSWPKYLESLELAAQADFVDWPTLPPSLTNLDCLGTEEEDTVLGSVPMRLPSRLAIITLSYWCCEWFHVIPRTVTYLTADGIDDSTDSETNHFLQLPSSLVRLHIYNGELQLAENSLAHLCHLESLDCRYLSIPSSALRYLPRTMKGLAISLETVDPIDLGFLPLSLTFCRLRLNHLWFMPDISHYWPPTLARFMHEGGIRDLVYERLRALDL